MVTRSSKAQTFQQECTLADIVWLFVLGGFVLRGGERGVAGLVVGFWGFFLGGRAGRRRGAQVKGIRPRTSLFGFLGNTATCCPLRQPHDTSKEKLLSN